MLAATSCQQNEPMMSTSSGDEAQLQFAIGLENGMAVRARAISDGKSADKLVYAVYDEAGTLIEGLAGFTDGQVIKENAFGAGLTESVSLTLAKGRTYTIVFWAQDADCSAYDTSDLKNVTIDYDGVNSDETRDAFFKAETFTVTENKTISVTLRRPFAQINVGVTQDDWDSAVASGTEIQQSKVVINNAATQLNLLTGAASGSQEATYALNAIPQESLNVDTDGDGTKESYKWLSMSYILVADESADGTSPATLDGLQFTFQSKTGSTIEFSQGLNNVPVQRNWRTNILGRILCGDTNIKITIDPAYEDDNNIETVVSSSSELTAALKDASVRNITLTQDVTGIPGVFDDITSDKEINLNGYSWTNPTTNRYPLTVNQGISVTVKNGTIVANSTSKDSYTSVANVNGTLTVDNVTVETNAVPFSVENTGSLTIKNSTVKSPSYCIATNASNPKQNVTINLENSSFDGDNPIFLNIPGNLTMNGCTVKGLMTGVLVRGGTATITDCDISFDTDAAFTDQANAEEFANYFNDINWGSGNMVNLAAITLGNKSEGSYQYPTNVTLNNVRAKVTGAYADLFPVVYVHANQGEGLGVTLVYDKESTFTGSSKGIVYGSENITVNGESVTLP